MNNNMREKVFYHIYPLGFCGAPERNDFSCPAGPGLRSLVNHIPHLLSLGVKVLYIGPLFESTAHGYDTLDYYHVDRRLGNNEDLVRLVRACHDQGIAVILDAVLNHTGRHFFAFRDLQTRKWDSAYRDWFSGVDFSRSSPEGDPFSYEGWNGCYDLVRLNGHSPEVREHLFGAVKFWIEEFDIDGLRLDAADKLLPDFMDALNRRCKALKKDFWLLGEVIHGDYCHWAQEGRLDSVTNYELYKGLWSSFNDRNFFELAWTLNRQFGPGGLYPHVGLYNFADNHDVNRVASILRNKAHLFPLYGLLFTVPGIPSLYYGSELGAAGERTPHCDRMLRPCWDRLEPAPGINTGALLDAIRRFSAIRRETPALRFGSYRQLMVSHEQFAFIREPASPPDFTPDPGSPNLGSPNLGSQGPYPRVLVAVNASAKGAFLHIPREALGTARWKDLLEGGELRVASGGLDISLYSSWLRILEECQAG
jgi:glycosidase